MRRTDVARLSHVSPARSRAVRGAASARVAVRSLRARNCRTLSTRAGVVPQVMRSEAAPSRRAVTSSPSLSRVISNATCT
jgi:hypothetical protein